MTYPNNYSPAAVATVDPNDPDGNQAFYASPQPGPGGMGRAMPMPPLGAIPPPVSGGNGSMAPGPPSTPPSPGMSNFVQNGLIPGLAGLILGGPTGATAAIGGVQQGMSSAYQRQMAMAQYQRQMAMQQAQLNNYASLEQYRRDRIAAAAGTMGHSGDTEALNLVHTFAAPVDSLAVNPSVTSQPPEVQAQIVGAALERAHRGLASFGNPRATAIFESMHGLAPITGSTGTPNAPSPSPASPQYNGGGDMGSGMIGGALSALSSPQPPSSLPSPLPSTVAASFPGGYVPISKAAAKLTPDQIAMQIRGAQTDYKDYVNSPQFVAQSPAQQQSTIDGLRSSLQSQGIDPDKAGISPVTKSVQGAAIQGPPSPGTVAPGQIENNGLGYASSLASLLQKPASSVRTPGQVANDERITGLRSQVNEQMAILNNAEKSLPQRQAAYNRILQIGQYEPSVGAPDAGHLVRPQDVVAQITPEQSIQNGFRKQEIDRQGAQFDLEKSKFTNEQDRQAYTAAASGLTKTATEIQRADGAKNAAIAKGNESVQNAENANVLMAQKAYYQKDIALAQKYPGIHSVSPNFWPDAQRTAYYKQQAGQGAAPAAGTATPSPPFSFSNPAGGTVTGLGTLGAASAAAQPVHHSATQPRTQAGQFNGPPATPGPPTPNPKPTMAVGETRKTSSGVLFHRKN